MGFGGISIWQLLIILAIVLMIFGTKKLKNLGGDLGGAIKGFKDAMSEDKKEDKNSQEKISAEDDTPADAGRPDGAGDTDTATKSSDQDNRKSS